MSDEDLYLARELPLPDHSQLSINHKGIRIPLPVVNQQSFDKSYAAWISNPDVPPVYAWYNTPGCTPPEHMLNLDSTQKENLTQEIIASIKSGQSIQTSKRNKIQVIHLFLIHVGKHPETIGLPEDLKDILQKPGHIRLAHAFLDFPPLVGIDLKQAWVLAIKNDPQDYTQWFVDHHAPWINTSSIVHMDLLDRLFILSRFYVNPRTILPKDINSQCSVHLMQNMHRALYNQYKYIPLLREKYPQLYAKKAFNICIFAYKECQPIIQALLDGHLQHVIEVCQAYNEASFMDPICIYFQILHPAIQLPDLTIDYWRANHRNIAFLYYTDEQLVRFFGLLTNIDSSMALNYSSQMMQDSWFLFQASQHIFIKPGDSKVGTDLVPFAQSEVPYLAHGNFVQGFTFYDVDGLARHFQSNEGMTLTDPWTRQAFRNGDLTHIQSLVEHGIYHDLLPEETRSLLLHELENYIVYGTPNEGLSITKIKNHIQDNRQQREAIHSFFLNFFYLGMYLRRWKGGHEDYPIDEHQNGSGPPIGSPEEIQATMKITESCICVRECMTKIDKDIQSAIWSLPLYQKYDVERVSFGTMHACMVEVERGEYCIRYASGIFSYTAARHMHRILGVHPPRFDYRTNCITIH